MELGSCGCLSPFCSFAARRLCCLFLCRLCFCSMKFLSSQKRGEKKVVFEADDMSICIKQVMP